MSDLHKQFLKKVKQQENSLGLLPENGETSSRFPQLPTGSFSPPSRPSRNMRTSQNHNDIYNGFIKERDATFKVIDTYTDPDTSISFKTYYKPPEGKHPVFFGVHGAGSSAMTFCKLAQELKQAGLFVFDMRGHGESGITDPVDFSLLELTKDFSFIISKFHSLHAINDSSIYLVGHSLGGSVLTNYLVQYPDNGFNIKGLVMLDIVEETAVSSLHSMSGFLDKIPSQFPHYKQAIDWHVSKAALLKNPNAAYLSVPSLFKDEDGALKWKIDLHSTEPFWKTWFKGLSANFVTCGLKQHVAKLLILAGHETLDTNLIIGQMQGKYQLIVFNDPLAGHFLHEDIASKVAISLIDFSKRNDSPDEYMEKELGFKPKWGGKIHQ